MEIKIVDKMKLAIITLTVNGQKIANQLKQKLDADPTVLKVEVYHKKVKQTLNKIFGEYDCILGIMASGIMIRSICPLIRDKTEDPAVLIMDEKSKHVISLLSGHIGGGNKFALKIAELSGAEPVITTSTDVNGKIGIDSLAGNYHFILDDYSDILKINQALVNNEVVKLAVPKNLDYLCKDKLIKDTFHIIKSPHQLMACYKDTIITLTPKRIVLGLGTRKGITKDAILHALHEACHDLEIPEERIDYIATAEPKKNEKGILEAANKLGIPLDIISLDDIRKIKDSEISESAFVRKTFDVPGICEPAALYVAGERSKLLYGKKAFDGVTIAVAVSG